MSIWINAPSNILEGTEADEMLQQINDKAYWNDKTGAIEVPKRRWEEAQKFERDGWFKEWAGACSDRNHEHAAIFNNYQDLPNDLGEVMEIGCGLFTQTSTILQGRTANMILLQDPLIHQYFTHPHCNYGYDFSSHAVGRLRGYPTIPVTFIAGMAENCDIKNFMSTVICINVIEHVMSVQKVLDALFESLTHNGLIIFGERTYDTGYNPDKQYDIGHPIRVKSSVILNFKKRFTVLHDYSNEQRQYFIGRKP